MTDPLKARDAKEVEIGPTTLDAILLPGFDGTGRLFESFVEALPPQLKASVMAYPVDVPQTYSDLAMRVRSTLPRDRPFVIVAESFSGPIAIRVAAMKPNGLVALVLVGTFIRSPVRFVPAWMRPLLGGYLFRILPPAWLIRWLVAGPDASAALISEAHAAWRLVKPGALASRLQDVLSVNVVDDFRQVTVPMLYLRGTQDRLLAAATVQELQRLHPDLEVVSIASPHFILQRRPVEAAAAISGFLARCGAI
jgi:pimeloyl-ACP methyl ester carboxylesterase